MIPKEFHLPMQSSHRAPLTNLVTMGVLAVCVLATTAGAQPTPTPAPTPTFVSVDPTTAPRRVWRPIWRTTLPFQPTGALLDQHAFYLAHRLDDGIEITSSPLTVHGEPTFANAEQWPAPRRVDLGEHAAATSGDVYALGDRWAFVDDQAGRLVVTDASMGFVESVVDKLPLTDIDGASASFGRLLLSGRDELGNPRVAAALLPLNVTDGAAPWTLTFPLPEARAGAAYFATETRLYAMGGIEDNGQGPFATPLMLAHLMEGDGASKGWLSMPFALKPAPGRAIGVQVERLLAVMGENRVVDGDDNPTSPSLAYTLDYSNRRGAVDPWRPVLLDMPAITQPQLVSSVACSQLVVIGRVEEQGVARHEAWGFFASTLNPENTAAASYWKIIAERAEQRRLRFHPYAESMETARLNKVPHVVVFLGDDADSDAIRQNLTRDPNVINMMRGIMLSSPWPEDTAAARQKTGVTMTPAFALIDAEGQVVSRKEGALRTAADMVKFLGPVMGPPAITPTPTPQATP